MARILILYGTRPEAIKLAPVIQDLQATSHEVHVVVTGQHREMLDQVNAAFGIVPDRDLDLMVHGQSLAALTAASITGLSRVTEEIAPDLVIVQGDTTTTMAAALAAFYAGSRVLHVEAGLRTGDRLSPYPEEMNRLITTRLSDMHAAPTARARRALLDEGVPRWTVEVTGNTVVDALQRTLRSAGTDLGADPALADVVARGGEHRPLIVATMHRRESWGEGLARIGDALREIARQEPSVLIVVPIHRNPIVRREILPRVDGLENVLIVEPLSYLPFTRLLSRARLVLTDSGGIQEEAPALGVPVLVLRESTERPEAVDSGAAVLVGTDPVRIVATTVELLNSDETHAAMANAVNPFGDGHAAERIVAMVDRMVGSEGPAAPTR